VLTNNAWDVAPTDGIMTNTLLLSSSPFIVATSYVGAANGTDKLQSAIESANFKLVTGSSCINAGDNTYVTAITDLADTSRIIGSNVDLGCYESSFTTAAGFVNTKKDGLRINGNKIMLPQTAIGKTIRVFNINGMQIKNFVAETPEITILDKGVYIVSINSDVYKVIL